MQDPTTCSLAIISFKSPQIGRERSSVRSGGFETVVQGLEPVVQGHEANDTSYRCFYEYVSRPLVMGMFKSGTIVL